MLEFYHTKVGTKSIFEKIPGDQISEKSDNFSNFMFASGSGSGLITRTRIQDSKNKCESMRIRI
jgi:hypothetical protein